MGLSEEKNSSKSEMPVTEAEMHLCRRCHEISFEKLAQPGGFTHSEQLSLLLKSANVCVLCGLILRALSESDDIIDKEVMTDDVFHKLFRVTLRWRRSKPELCFVQICAIEASCHRLRSLAVSMLVAKWRRSPIDIDIETFFLNAGRRTRGMDWKLPLTGQVAIRTDDRGLSAAYGMSHCRRLPQTTNSAESTEVLTTWLDSCVHDHGHDEPLTSAASKPKAFDARSTRFVEIQAFDKATGHIRVRLVHASSAETRYATLSYVWGPKPHGWRTTRANVHSRSTDGFDISELPPTLKDTISVAASLCIDYVWIDCLCIIQDDAEEWAREAASMRSIYANSVLNIAADKGSSPRQGLHSDRSTAQSGGVGAWIQVKEEFDQSRALYFHWVGRATNYYANPGGPISKDPPHFSGRSTDALDAYEASYENSDWLGLIISSQLNQRAWVFQERLLSKRMVHFTDVQMFWQCEHLRESEDQFPLYFPESQGRGLISDMPPFPSPSRVESMSSFDFAHLWYQEIVRPYSSRDITFKSDKLVAISGIAELLQRSRPGVRYLAGLWSDSILQGLTWNVGASHLFNYDRPRSELEDTKRLRTNAAPSWSWGSRDVPRSFAFFDSTVWCCKVICCDTKTLNDDPFGPVLAGTLVLEGQLLEASLVDAHEEVLPDGADRETEATGTELCVNEDLMVTHACNALVSSNKETVKVRCDIHKEEDGSKDGEVWTKVGDGDAWLSPEIIEAIKPLHFEPQRITIV